MLPRAARAPEFRLADTPPGPRWSTGTTSGNRLRTRRMLNALIIEKEHPIFRPVPPHTNQHELLAMPRMARMGHPDSPLPSVGIRST